MTSTSSPSYTDDETAIQSVPLRIVAAWADNDAEAFAAVFTEDSSLILPGDIYLTSRDEIRAFMGTAFSGPYKGTRVFGTPLAVKRLSSDVALIITEGGVLAPGEDEVATDRAIRASWVLVRQGSDWLIAAYQNTPIAGS